MIKLSKDFHPTDLPGLVNFIEYDKKTGKFWVRVSGKPVEGINYPPKPKA